MNLIDALNAWAERRQRRYELRTLARAQQLAARRHNSGRIVFRDWLAAFLVLAFMSALFFMLKWAFPKQNEQIIVYMLGQLSGFTAAALALYFTTSRHEEQSSERRADERDKTLEVVKTLANNVTTTDKPSGNPGDPVHVTEEDKQHA